MHVPIATLHFSGQAHLVRQSEMASRTRLLTDGRVSFSIQDKTCLGKAMGKLPICILPELVPYNNRDLSAESSEIRVTLLVRTSLGGP